jgi:hypothetical protein
MGARREFIARRGGVARFSTGAAAGEAADHPVSWRQPVRSLESLDCRLFGTIKRAWLDRGSQRGDRVSLGRGTCRAFCRDVAEFVHRKVFALVSDPHGSGLVTSLSRPGGNVHRRCSAMPGYAGSAEEMREVLNRHAGHRKAGRTRHTFERGGWKVSFYDIVPPPDASSNRPPDTPRSSGSSLVARQRCSGWGICNRGVRSHVFFLGRVSTNSFQ